MKNALIIGGNGLTGKKLTRLLMADKRYRTVKLVVRKPMDIIYEKLEQIPFDFDKPDATKVQADEVFCCIGTTNKNAGSKEAFYMVDYEYVLTLANIAYTNGCKKFALISSMGANKSSAVFYYKTKGQIEGAIKAIGFENCFIFRPSILLGTRQQFRFGESVAKFLLTKLSFLLPKKYRPIHSKSVAFAMKFVMNGNYSGFKVFESDEIAEIATFPH
jgi:uncharacterized protein YbjT (DUF2867 family)